MVRRRQNMYYQANGFSTYYFANAVFNIVRSPMAYMRGIEEILGDLRTTWFMQPFKKYTNLHEFIHCIVSEIVFDDAEGKDSTFRTFLRAHDIHVDVALFDDEDALLEMMAENDKFAAGLDSLTEEVFHVLFNDVGFLANFNQLCANYFENAPYVEQPEKLLTNAGTLRRAMPPAWARTAIFHRDKGECRDCKKPLARLINQIDLECYDHIIPLAAFGANDVTNLQLLCDGCNSRKRATIQPVSKLYPKAIQT